MGRSATFRAAATIAVPTATPAPVAVPEKTRVRHHHAIPAAIHHADAPRASGQEADAEREGEATDQMDRLMALNFSGAGKIKSEAAAGRHVSRFYFHKAIYSTK
jgi:hypothetical protein